MAEIRCPMCGKPNPAERDTCQFCDARLKPLIAGSPPDSGASGSDTPDWLDGLRDEQGNVFDLGAAAGGQDESEDWLARLGETVDGGPFVSESSETPDWMSGLGETEATAAFETPDLGASDLFTEQPAGEETQPETPAFSSQDWFTDSAETPVESAGDAGADWFSQQAETAFTEGEESDWFSQSAEPASPGSEQPDWFSQPVEPGQPEGGLPDWLSSAGEEAESPTAPAFDARALFGDAAADEEATHSDWQPTEEAAQPAGELPDWLGWDAAPGETPAAEETPDWLAATAGSQEPAAAPEESASAWDAEWPSSESTPTGDESLAVSPFSFLEDDEEATAAFGLEPGWSAGAEPAPQDAPTALPSSDEPDWLSSLTADAAASAFPFDISGAGETGSAEEEAPAVSPFADWGGEGQTPDWLRAGPGDDSAQAPGASAFSFDDEGSLEGRAEGSGPQPLEATPDWISQVSAEDATLPSLFPVGEEESEQAAPDLAPANLPGWLEAMRPVDAVALEDLKDTSDERMETEGPLAGLRGALPAGLDAGAVTVPPAHSFKLQVTEEANVRLKLLSDLLAAETQPLKPAAGVEFMTGALIRLVLFVALMLAAIWALWYGEQPGTAYLQSSALSPAAAAFQQQVSLLPGEPVVLVAVEAETAFAGEMDAAADGLLTFLASRRAQIYFVSTNTAGPILAERFMENLARQPARGGVAYTSYTNLGYLSGGPAGLVAFLNDPEGFTALDLAGQPAWGALAAAARTGLQKFDAVVVLSSSSENARLWVEQAGPLLRPQAIPLLFSVSAQVSPVLQPYFNAAPRQVDGILSGLPETYQFTRTNALEQFSGEPGEARRVIDAYSAVVLAAVIILLIGTVVNLLSHLLPARAKERNA